MSNKTLLIVFIEPSPNVKKIKQAVVDGVNSMAETLTVKVVSPLEATADDVLRADAIILGTTENFGYMSGEMKTFFDRIYYPCLEEKQGLPYLLIVKAGMDGTGAIRSVTKIITGLRWREVQEPFLMVGKFQPDWLQQCHELGQAMAAGVSEGIF